MSDSVTTEGWGLLKTVVAGLGGGGFVTTVLFWFARREMEQVKENRDKWEKQMEAIATAVTTLVTQRQDDRENIAELRKELNELRNWVLGKLGR